MFLLHFDTDVRISLTEDQFQESTSHRLTMHTPTLYTSGRLTRAVRRLYRPSLVGLALRDDPVPIGAEFETTFTAYIDVYLIFDVCCVQLSVDDIHRGAVDTCGKIHE